MAPVRLKFRTNDRQGRRKETDDLLDFTGSKGWSDIQGSRQILGDKWMSNLTLHEKAKGSARVLPSFKSERSSRVLPSF